MRVRGLAALLAGVVVVAGALALRPTPGASGTQAAVATARAQSTTPVLSPRRVPALLTRVVAGTRLAGALDAALGDPNLGPARDHACLTVAGDGRQLLFSRQSDLPLIPASNLKLLTGLAVLDRIGPDTRLRTDVRAALGRDGVVAGDLWLVGGGDPLLGTQPYAASFDRLPHLYTPLEELAHRVAAAGVKIVQGRVVGDESRYDSQRYVPSWRPRYIADSEIGPQSALTVNDNFAQWQPRHLAAAQPAVNAAAVFTDLLRANGVTVVGVPAEGRVPPHVSSVASLDSLPMSDVVGEMLRESDNLTAELLTKELGRRDGGPDGGTTARGTAVVRSVLGAHHLPVRGLATVDGSGLDRSDRATCDLLLSALRTGASGPLSAGLPVADQSGTLEKRFTGTPAAGHIRAKTGSLDGVSALTGFAEGRSGALAFSLVLNDLPRDALGPAVWEAVGRALVAYPDAPDPNELGPAS